MFENSALELINSDGPGGLDLLRDPAWLADFAARWGLGSPAGVGAAEIDQLARLRSLLRRLAGTMTAGSGLLSGPGLRELNKELARTPIVAQLERAGNGYLVDMTPVAKRWGDTAARECAGAFASMLRSDPPRLKLCSNEACRSAFWDESRSRSRRWCDSRKCGNRMRVQRHRARQGS